MTDHEEKAFHYLSKQVPNGYRINELIYFSYPVRRIMLTIQANKQPDQTLSRIYQSILKTVQAGIHARKEVLFFLGIDPLDEFMARELIHMRELQLLDFVGENLIVTEKGSEFVRDNTFLRIIETENYTFLIDGLTDQAMSYREFPSEGEAMEKRLNHQLEYAIKSPDLLKNRFDQISQVYKEDNQGAAYLISLQDDRVMRDFNEWLPLILIEYVPTSGNRDPRIEIRRPQDGYPKMDAMTKLFNRDYRHLLFELSDSDRMYAQEDLAAVGSKAGPVQIPEASITDDVITNLGVWETKRAFEEVLATAKSKVLIESPWIKRATQHYLPAMEKLAKNGISIYILYGIDEDTEHDHRTLRKLEALAEKYVGRISLISLPDHFAENGIAGRHGTHRKLVIKDDEFYISGSFNFLSFNMREGESIANEESHLIRRDVDNKWEKVVKEYGLENIVRI